MAYPQTKFYTLNSNGSLHNAITSETIYICPHIYRKDINLTNNEED